MWNHSENTNATHLNNHDLTYREKLEKSFDLSPYLSYVQQLFNATSSDSETSDNEVQGLNNSLVSEQTLDQQPSSNSSFSGHSSLNSSPGSSSASDFSSCSDSEQLTKDSSLATRLKPISDEELQNLLRVHKSWKKSPYPLGSDEDMRSLFNASSSTKHSNVNMGTTSGGGGRSSTDSKSTTSKNNRTGGGGSGGGLNTVSNPSFEPQSTSDNKNRSRKQSFKVLRREEVAGVSSSSSTSSSSTSSSTMSKGLLPTMQANQSSSSLGSGGGPGGGSANLIDNTVVSSALKNIRMDIDIKSEDGKRISATAQAANVSVTGAPTNFMDDDDSENEDDDSLSDYVAMAATVQSVGGQMLSNPIQNPIVSFKNVITSATSASSSSSSTTMSLTKQGTSTTSSKSFNAGSTSLDMPKKKKEKDLKDVPKQKKMTPHKQAKLIEVLNMKRRRVYVLLCKKEIGKTQRQRTNNHKEMLVIKRRLAQGCSRNLRQKAIQSQKTMKESVWRAKRLTREMLAYWKQADRVEREIRKRREKEAEEQRKLDVELMEAKRQQRKLNFLITQTELYAHFMSKKLGRDPGADDEARILSQLNEDKSTRVTRLDDYDSETMKNKAKTNVEHAFKTQLTQVQLFDLDVAMREDFKTDLKLGGEEEEVGELPQPSMFTGILKHYQLKGMNWLVNLYDQGINGILADEMGLGKTVQSIAFLANVAERYHVWGPFLIIAPASTLHNWQQEFKRFVPRFKVVPYWGNPQERKILRQFWQQSNVHTEEASFHVVVTSYQIVLADIKYFNRIKWQYLILDEAQAIKSTASARWKMLLGFSCRNRLLLTGTPIQNTMGELWALLHFIMPSLFDSHEEFNEWFSKDIESHAENKSFIDEKHLSRLHLILKPFMLRRIKKDVENELSDKVEVLVYCPLTSRQRLLYTVLKKKIRIEDLLKSSGPSNSQLAQHATTNLMNLVMQFRKVCNHPDLFERREIQSPHFLPNVTCLYPKLIFRDGILHLSLPSKRHLLENKLSIFNPEHIHRSLTLVQNDMVEDENKPVASSSSCEWSFLRLSGLGVGELSNIVYGGLIERWKHLLHLYIQLQSIYYRRTWGQESSDSATDAMELSEENSTKCLKPCNLLIWPENRTSFLNVKNSVVLRDLILTSHTSSMYTLADHKIHRIPETLEHRKMRSRKAFPAGKPPLLPELTTPSAEQFEVRQCQLTFMPSFLYNMCPKLWGSRRELYFSDRSAAWWQRENQMCTSSVGYKLIMRGEAEPWWNWKRNNHHFIEDEVGGLAGIQSTHGWSRVVVPDKEKLVTDSGKLGILDNLLQRLKMNGHRVLIYSQMTKMIDILEEYMWHRKWTYMRLDGSSKIAERRDMVADFQSRSDIFVFLLSTRAGGLGINLTAADTVIFYDSDWNPTVDQQAMDRAHRLGYEGQTKQVHVYRLICKGTIEERILQRAREKNEIQRMVISGGNFRSDTLKPKEVVSLLLDDEELEKKYRQKQAERKLVEEVKSPAAEGGKDSKPAAASVNLKRKHSSKAGPTEKLLASVELASNVSSSAAGSVEGSAPGSPSRSDVNNGYQDMVAGEVEIDSEVFPECMEEEVSSISNEGSTSFNEELDVQMSPSEGFNKTIEWNADIHSDGFETDFPVLPKRPKVGRGTGKRGRPPSRVRVQVRETDADNSVKGGQPGAHPIERRRPGRPRLRPVGPANVGIRGRRPPGRPPLSSRLTPLTTSQRVFGFYSSPDLT